MATQKEKAERFKALHEREGAFIIPNAWDLSSARLLAGLSLWAREEAVRQKKKRQPETKAVETRAS